MSPYPLQDRRQHPRHAPLTATPPEAGNIHFPDIDGTEDIGDWWPITGRQVAAFWAIAGALAALIMTGVLLGTGYAWDLSTGEIVYTLLNWGL